MSVELEPRSEALTPHRRITPVFGAHNDPLDLVSGLAVDFREWQAKEGKMMTEEMWDFRVEERVKGARVMGIDGLSGTKPDLRAAPTEDVKTSHGIYAVYAAVPAETPFDLRWNDRDVFIVGGDVFEVGMPENSTQAVILRGLNKRIVKTIQNGDVGEEEQVAIDLRNAVVAIKLHESHQVLPEDEISDGPTVAVFGDMHRVMARHRDVWNNPQAQRRALICAMPGMVYSIEDEFREADIEITPDAFTEIQRTLAEFLGSTNLWRVGTEPERHTYDDVKRQITLVQHSISPTITGISNEATSTYWAHISRGVSRDEKFKGWTAYLRQWIWNSSA